ncbi:MAG: bifunctional metallophosphatase/5'-nucleotidase [Nitrospiraceae bacterium]|nr:bifunctional metallophosphatase/5'-nucleotidase [Nitrospiraceae bacterium]
MVAGLIGISLGHHIFAADRHEPDPAHIKILAINDFHGSLSAGRTVGNRPVGGAAVLASYLKAAQTGWEDRTVLVHAGDHVGASPPVSALLQDEPAMMFLNLLANEHCAVADRHNPHCNVVGTPGNHEFDEGQDELKRLLDGGTHLKGPFLEAPYEGIRFPYVSANVVGSEQHRSLFPPYVVKSVGSVRVGFIRAVLNGARSLVSPSGIVGLAFLDEAEAINRTVEELRAQNVRVIVVLIHQGGEQAPYEGPTRPDGMVTGPIVDIVSRLDDEIDVVVSGHTHRFTNALLRNGHGKEMLVTQAFSYGSAYADIELGIDQASQDVLFKSARIITTFADEEPGTHPDQAVLRLVAQAEATVAPKVARVVGQVAADISRIQNEAGESPLGNLIADAQRWAMKTDIAFMNRGGIGDDLHRGNVMWGDVLHVHRFGNTLIRMELTGQQIYDVLNQQWLNQDVPRMLQLSGLSYTWDSRRPMDDRIVEIRMNGAPIDRQQTYSVAVNSYLAEGGDRFTLFTQGGNRVGGPPDGDALIAYIQSRSEPISASIEGRIQRLN